MWDEGYIPVDFTISMQVSINGINGMVSQWLHFHNTVKTNHICLYVRKHENLELRLELQSVCAYVAHDNEKVRFIVKVVQKNLFEPICCPIFVLFPDLC